MRIWVNFAVGTAFVGVTFATHAGDRWFRRSTSTPQHQMVTPNGVVVPAWATRRIENSTVPLFAPSFGRRPWANALSMANTPSARWARASELGWGAGPYPGYTNGPLLGNYPQAAVGPNDTIVSPRQPIGSGFPFNVELGGF